MGRDCHEGRLLRVPLASPFCVCRPRSTGTKAGLPHTKCCGPCLRDGDIEIGQDRLLFPSPFSLCAFAFQLEGS